MALVFLLLACVALRDGKSKMGAQQHFLFRVCLRQESFLESKKA